MKNTKNTCATCISYRPGQEDACANLVTFREPGTSQSRQPGPSNTCPDHDPREVSLYSHPDNTSEIKLIRIEHSEFSYGVLVAVDETGAVVRVPIGQVGLIELGLDLAKHGKDMMVY